MSEQKKQPEHEQNEGAERHVTDPSEPVSEAAVEPETTRSGDSDQAFEWREALLRTRAEMDNLEKRTQREIEKARKFMFEGVFKDLLPVVDGLDQGIETKGIDADADEGLALTRKLLLQTLQRHGLEMIDPEGESFDPQWHEAMSAQPSDDVPPETVLMVLQKGYRLHDRLLRPARVIISSSQG